MPEQYHVTVTVNDKRGYEHDLELGKETLAELPAILARLYAEHVSSLVVTLVKA